MHNRLLAFTELVSLALIARIVRSRIELSRMFIVLASALGGLLSAALISIVFKIISNRRTVARFVELSKGIPVLGNYKSIGNHLSTMFLSEDNVRTFAKAHETHGPYVAMFLDNTFALSTTDLDLIEQMIFADGALDRTTLHMPVDEYEESIMLVPGDRWPHQRKVFAPALKPNKFKTPNVIEEVEESIDKLVSHIERRLNENKTTLHVDDAVHKYTLNLVFSCFYKQKNIIDFDDPNEKWTHIIDEMLDGFQNNLVFRLSVMFHWLRRPLDWLIWNFHKQGPARREIIDFVRQQTKLGMEARKYAKELEAKGELKNRNTFMLKDGTIFKRNIVDNIIDGFLDGKLTQREYVNSSCLLLNAADKTVADSIVHTIYLLSTHQEIQERLRESVMRDGSESEYLGWVLNESLRLMPTVPGACGRTIKKPIELKNGQIVPEGTLVLTIAYAVHRLKQYWGDDAEEFKPERWADTSHHHPLQYIAFGAGIRGCLGSEFALFHMRQMFAALLTRYKFQGKPREDAYKISAPFLLFTIPSSPTYITIKRLESD